MKTLLILLLTSGVIFAQNNMYKKDGNNLTYKLVNGVYILWAGELPPIEVSAQRPDPQWPGTYVRSSGKYYWNSGANWHKYITDGDGEGDWEPTEDPTIMVQAGGDLSTGTFLSTETHHYVQAECEINIIKWDGVGIGNGSGDIDFSNDGNSPIITMYPQRADNGRTYALAYQVTGSVGEVSDRVTFSQNDLSILRQEYKDMRKNSTPNESAFDTSEPAYQDPQYGGLLDPDDYHGHHEHRILDDINTYAIRIDNQYSGTPPYTAGYACPGDNDHAPNSLHIYGRALDWDGGGDNLPSSKINYDVFTAAKKVAGITPYLYDNASPKNRYDRSVVPLWPNLPPGFVGNHYSSGHADW